MTDKIMRSEEFSLESFGEKDGEFFFTAKSLSKDFECEEGLKRLANDSTNKHLVWRHRHPIEEQHKENHVYGNVENSWVADGFIFSKYHAYKHTPDHIAFINVIKERIKIGDPLGISMHYRRYSKDNKPVHYDVFEHSGTPYPVCEKCKTINFKVEQMVNEDKKQPDIKEEEKKEINEDEIFKKIDELESQLNAKTEALNEYKTKLDTLELEIKKKEEEIEESKSEKDRIIELEKLVDYLGKKPILDEIKTLSEIDDREFEWLKTQDEEYITKKLEKARKDAQSKVHTKDIDESAEESITKTDEEFEDKEKDKKVEFEKFVKFVGLKEHEK